MKKWRLLLCAHACLCLLAACAASGGAETQPQDPPPKEPGESTAACRVISQMDGGALVLAEQDDAAGIYTVSLRGKVLTLDGAAFDPAAPGAYQALPGASLAGTTVTVTFDGGIQESWPMRFSGVTALDFSTEDFNDLGALYLRVLEDLWAVDGALNQDITELGVDLTATRLGEGERAAVAYAFGAAHGLTAMEATFDELVELGYISAAPLLASGLDPEMQEPEHYFYQWEDGCLFSISESDEPVAFSMPAQAPGRETAVYEGIRFDAAKWRTSLAAYTFDNCTAVRAAGGAWGDYAPEAEMIS